MILTVVTLLLCGCPGILSGLWAGLIFAQSPESLLEQNQVMQIIPPENEAMVAPVLWVMRIVSCLVGELGVAVHVVFGVIMMRMRKKDEERVYE